MIKSHCSTVFCSRIKVMGYKMHPWYGKECIFINLKAKKIIMMIIYAFLLSSRYRISYK